MPKQLINDMYAAQNAAKQGNKRAEYLYTNRARFSQGAPRLTVPQFNKLPGKSK